MSRISPTAWHWLILLLSLLLAGCDAPKHAMLPPGATVLVLGDSISYGVGAAPGEDFPTLLAAATGWQVINAGVPGDTTADGLRRLPELLDRHAPQLLLVALGGNDILRKLPASETADNLGAILAMAQARGIQAVLVGAPAPNLLGAALGRLDDHPLYLEVAEAAGVPLVSGVLGAVLSRSELKADPIHPNAAGYRELERRLREQLQRHGFLC